MRFDDSMSKSPILGTCLMSIHHRFCTINYVEDDIYTCSADKYSYFASHELIIATQRSSTFITEPPRTIIKSCQSTGHPSGSELYFWLLHSLKQKREIYESCNNNLVFGKSLGIISITDKTKTKNFEASILAA